jgi:hypothetical protein
MATVSKADTPDALIAAIDEPRRSEVRELDGLITSTAPDLERYVISGMLGYGRYHYRGASGREGDWCRIGLANNKATISLHVLAADESGYLPESYADRLPKADIGKSCIRFKRLEDVDLGILEHLIRKAAVGPAPGEIEG